MNTRRHNATDDGEAGPPVTEERPDAARIAEQEDGPAADDRDQPGEADGGRDDPLMGRRLF